MPRIAKPEDVRYLAFEGGGGKGVTYLGTILALQKLKILPIKKKENGNQILGISGSSAGAITALFLSMGLTYNELKKVLTRKVDFNKFFDNPSCGWYRCVNSQNLPDIASDAPSNLSGTDLLNFFNERMQKVKVTDLIKYIPILSLMVSPNPWGVLLGMSIITFILYKKNKFFEEHENNPILNQIGKNIDSYIYNLVYDRGIFPGVTVRRFFAWMISTYMQKYLGTAVRGDNINFFQFEQLTGIDLVITGVNVTQNKPGQFSKKLTPDFPVAEAVAISMNLPFLFKPIYVDAQVAPESEKNPNVDRYKGFWVDGGLLNNLPIHAFDEADSGSSISDIDPNLRPLNPNVLGIRLMEGYEDPKQNINLLEKESGVFDILSEHLKNLLDTMLYPSELGQLRTVSEKEQTIPLYTDELITTEFSPAESDYKKPVENAYNKTINYFKKSK